MLTFGAPQAKMLWDWLLPVEATELPKDWARIDELLRDTTLLRPIADNWERPALGTGGRRSR